MNHEAVTRIWSPSLPPWLCLSEIGWESQEPRMLTTVVNTGWVAKCPGFSHVILEWRCNSPFSVLLQLQTVVTEQALVSRGLPACCLLSILVLMSRFWKSNKDAFHPDLYVIYDNLWNNAKTHKGFSPWSWNTESITHGFVRCTFWGISIFYYYVRI